MKNEFAVIIPVLNGGKFAVKLISSIRQQSLQPDTLLVIDSYSTDNSPFLFQSLGSRIHTIPRAEFSHGGTRQLGVDMIPEASILFFLTQDAILASPDSFKKLLSCFTDGSVGAAYGRQLPHPDATSIGAHARIFNYPSQSHVRGQGDISQFGIKVAFISNSFAAYRRKALFSCGGFPASTIFGEDTYVAAKMILNGWKVAYCADAMVYHSHNYGFFDEFHRYFDIGVFHAREPWIRQNFGNAEGEGFRYLKSELKYLWKENRFLIPAAIVRTLLKFLGYKIGMLEKYIPLQIKRTLTLNHQFWEKENSSR